MSWSSWWKMKDCRGSFLSPSSLISSFMESHGQFSHHLIISALHLQIYYHIQTCSWVCQDYSCVSEMFPTLHFLIFPVTLVDKKICVQNELIFTTLFLCVRYYITLTNEMFVSEMYHVLLQLMFLHHQWVVHFYFWRISTNEVCNLSDKFHLNCHNWLTFLSVGSIWRRISGLFGNNPSCAGCVCWPLVFDHIRVFHQFNLLNLQETNQDTLLWLTA